MFFTLTTHRVLSIATLHFCERPMIGKNSFFFVTISIFFRKKTKYVCIIKIKVFNLHKINTK